MTMLRRCATVDCLNTVPPDVIPSTLCPSCRAAKVKAAATVPPRKGKETAK